jgi:hypothetical protein
VHEAADSGMTIVTRHVQLVSSIPRAARRRARLPRLDAGKIRLELLEYASGYGHPSGESTTEDRWIATEPFARA